MASLVKMIPVHNCFLHTPIVMILDTQSSHESRMCPIDFEVKRQVHNALITENRLCRIIAIPLHLSS